MARFSGRGGRENRMLNQAAKPDSDMYRILIVSDDPFLRDMVRFALDGLGAEVRTPGDRSEALRLARRVLFDLVLVLAACPYADCEAMLPRRQRGMRRPRIFFVAWQHSEHAVLSVLDGGVDQYVTFPVNLQRLRLKVAECLNTLNP